MKQLKETILLLSLLCISIVTNGQYAISNSNFENTAIAWSNIAQDGSVANFSWSAASPQLGAQNLNIDVQTTGINAWSIQSISNTFNVVPGNTYSISFWAKSNVTAKALRVVLQNATYTAKDFSLSTGWTQYTADFTPSENTLQLKFNYLQTGIYSVDNIQLITKTVVNTPPSCVITSPHVNAYHKSASTITINAFATDKGGSTTGSISKVEFFNGTTKLGEATAASNNLYSYQWTNVSTGSYSLTAKATDNEGAIFTAAAVNIQVNTSDVLALGMSACKGKYLANILGAIRPTYMNYWNGVTSENSCKWGSVEGTRDVMNWSGADQAYNYAKDNNLMFRYHAIAWGSQYPSWITSLTPADFQAEVEEYMAAIAARYPLIDQIDVLNENMYINTYNGKEHADGTPYFRAGLGGPGVTGYDWAIWLFQKAREYFPNAKLVMNDFEIESNPAGIAEMLAVVKVLRDRGLIDGFGSQAHTFNIDGFATNPSLLSSRLDLMAGGGIPIYITELDLRGTAGTEASQLTSYQNILPAYWNHPAVAGISLWGYVEGATWISGSGLLNADGTERSTMTWLKNYMNGLQDKGYPFCTQTSYIPPTKFANTYLNPIQPGDHPDQTLLQIGNDYYSTGSSFHYTPYVPILHSKDLVHWEVISRVVPSNWSGLTSDAPSNGIWQGALAYFNNKFWVYYSNTNTQYFSSASTPSGPWSAPTKVTGSTVTGYDNSIFVDDDGTPYMLMKNGKSINRIQQIDKTTGQLTGTLLNMDWVNVGDRYSWAEGPVMCKRNGRYYYFVAGDVSGGQYVLSSATLTANEASWTIHGNFFDAATSPGGFTGPNHISQPVQIQDGTWWVLAHAYDNSGWAGQGRLGLLHQVNWDANGVPHGVPANVNPVAAPQLANTGIACNFPRSDDFSSSTLKWDWHFFNKTTATLFSLSDRPGYMRLKPGISTTHVCQTEGGHSYSLMTKIDVNATANGNQAGLRIMNGNDDLFVTLYSGYNNGKKIGLAFNGTSTEIVNTLGNVVWLKMVRTLHQITGFYSSNGINWTQIGASIDISSLDGGQANFNQWVGNSLALYATGVSADFDEFRFRDGATIIPAISYNNQNLVQSVSSAVGNVVGYIENNDWMMYAGVDFGSSSNSTTSVEIEAASGNGGGTIEIWIDDIDLGTKIATVAIGGTSGWEIWKKFTASCSVYGQHDVYLKCIGGSGGLFNLNTIRFDRTICIATITSPKNSFCTGSNVLLTANSGSSYKWLNGATAVGTTQTLTVTSAGDYTVQVTSATGCSAISLPTTITVNPLPALISYYNINSKGWQGGNALQVCIGDNVYTGPWPTVDPGWSWTGPNNFTSTLRSPVIAVINTNQGGIYTATYKDGNGCSSSLNLTVTVSVPVATITSPSASFCPGGNVTLTANTGTSYVWRDGTTTVGTSSTYIAKTAGSYTVIVSDPNSCKDTSLIKAITLSPVPVISITSPANNAVVTSDLFQINTSVTGTNISNVAFYNGTSLMGTDPNSPYNFTTPVLANGTYNFSAIAKNTSNCTDTAKVTVKVYKVVTGFEEISSENDKFLVSPNPFQHHFAIDKAGHFDYSITDGKGVVVESGKAENYKILGENLTSGFYILTLSDNTRTSKSSLIKQ